MSDLSISKVRIEHASLLRLISAIGSAAMFGMLASPVFGAAHYWPKAFALAFGYGFFFVGGTGYRILIAVALQDPARKASASWSGATAASASAALAGALLLAFSDPAGALGLIAAYVAAINFAYIPVKFACLEAGCCQAHRRAPLPIGMRDLRHVEILASAALLAATLTALMAGSAGLAAVAGAGGHLAVRLLSRWSRERLPRFGGGEAVGQELLPLALMFGFALWAAS